MAEEPSLRFNAQPSSHVGIPPAPAAGSADPAGSGAGSGAAGGAAELRLWGGGMAVVRRDGLVFMEHIELSDGREGLDMLVGSSGAP